MKIIVKKDYDSLSREAANMVREEIEKKRRLVLGLPTGSTPLGMYKELIRLHREERLDFSNVVSFNLDEYVGLSHDDPNSYHYYMKENFIEHVNIPKNNVFIPDGEKGNIEYNCIKYEELIEEKGGIDLLILGIGRNGHIGFNEPDEKLNLKTSVVELSRETIAYNSRFFRTIDEVPKKAITVGIGTIMKAKRIMLLASGKDKSETIKRLLEANSITTKFPASILHLHHDVTVIVDEDAFSTVNRRQIYDSGNRSKGFKC